MLHQPAAAFQPAPSPTVITSPAPQSDAALLALGQRWMLMRTDWQHYNEDEDRPSPAEDDAQFFRLRDAEEAIVSAMLVLPAVTPAGMAVKARLLIAEANEDGGRHGAIASGDAGTMALATALSESKVDIERMIGSLTADILRLAAAPVDGALLSLGQKLDAAKAAYFLAEKESEGDRSESADQRLDDLFKATCDVAEAIELLPATTLAGLQVKARALHWCHADEPIDERSFAHHDERPATDMRLAAGIVRDLLAIGAA